jgi:hypothetical protein
MNGADVALSGKMFDLLKEIYDKSENECDIAISFNQSASGAQQNPCRDLLVTYKKGPTLLRGQKIAERLATTTTHRSRLGLLFLVSGMEGLDHKVIISRFPADSGILAEQSATGLSISFLEKIFMKSAKSYKAVVYRHNSLTTGFWAGHAVDKQMNSSEAESSNYWIADFLDSDFLTTAAAGTRRLAIALRDAAKSVADIAVKNELVAAATLATGHKGQTLSIRSFASRIGLSADAKTALFGQVKAASLDEKFQLSADEFGKQLAYRSVELDSGGMLTAEIGKFDQVFQKTTLSGQRTRYATEGRVVNERVGKGKVR